jgi:hypothetical protein
MRKAFDIAISTDRHTERKAQRRPERLTVDVPPGTLTALKIHAALHNTTIREVITGLVHQALNPRRYI